MKLNELVIGTTGTRTKFLAESDLPSNARLSNQPADDNEIIVEEDRQLAEALARSAQAEKRHRPQGFVLSVIFALQLTRIKISTNVSQLYFFKDPPAATATGPIRTFPESDIIKLTNYGFTRDQVIEELTRSNGNVDQATAALFARSLAGPGSK